MMEFLKNFYSVGGADGKLVSERAIQANWIVAVGASPIGTVAASTPGSRTSARTSRATICPP